MSGKTVTKTTTQAPVVSPRVWIPLAVVLATVGGLWFWGAGRGLDLEPSLDQFIPMVLAVAGILLGAGIGLLIGEPMRTITVETTESVDATAAPGEAVLSESFKILKDLTPGKTLVVLSVALLGLSLWSVTPAKPDTQVTVPAANSTG